MSVFSHLTDNDSDGSVNEGSLRPQLSRHRREKKDFPVSLKFKMCI